MQIRALTPALALVAAAFPIGTAAHAQAMPVAAAGSYAFSKTEAILGGAPSALEAILAQQHGKPIPSRPALQPAAYSRPSLVPAVLRQPAAVSPGVYDGRPDVFGTVALRVGHTPLDARWRHVEHSSLSGADGRYAASLSRYAAVERLEIVNRFVNHRVRFTDDQVQYGRADVWSTASETLRKGRGDCEDYAIAKLQMLRSAGISDRDLYLVVLKDLVRRADHAVLVVRAAGHMFVLDNGTDRLLDSESVHDYRPVLTFAEGSTWTHGYRVDPTPVNVALVTDSALPPVIAASDQRSRSASLLAFNTGFRR